MEKINKTLFPGSLDLSVTAPQTRWEQNSTDDQALTPALSIAWSRNQPERIGEVALLRGEGSQWLLGRGPERHDDPSERLSFGRHRPGLWSPSGPLIEASISRRQLQLTREGHHVRVVQLGRCPLFVNGALVNGEALLSPGDTLHLKNQLLLVCVLRPARMAASEHFPPDQVGPYGLADHYDMVGESWTAWQLRDRLARVAALDDHTLLLGASGSGKELCARALHGLSRRRSGAWVTRNASTLPESLIDAELFGNARNYPNPGNREREGLIGATDGGCLFLDEIGDLPANTQAHLLRVLDADGEYQRLGESRTRRSDLRMLAATNRPPQVLQDDLRARFTLKLSVPPLTERREDIPLLIQHLLRTALTQSPILKRFSSSAAPNTFRIDPRLVDVLVRRPYTTHIRELKALLWEAISLSQGKHIALPGGRSALTEAHLDDVDDAEKVTREASTRRPGRDPASVTLQEIEAAMREHEGNVTRAARSLQLSSRHALNRLLKKHALTPDDYRDAVKPTAASDEGL